MEKLCRICLNLFIGTNSVSILHHEDVEGIQIRDKFRECSGIVVKEFDYLPQKICTKCLENINYFYDFLNLCRNSDKILRNPRYKYENKGYKNQNFSIFNNPIDDTTGPEVNVGQCYDLSEGDESNDGRIASCDESKRSVCAESKFTVNIATDETYQNNSEVKEILIDDENKRYFESATGTYFEVHCKICNSNISINGVLGEHLKTYRHQQNLKLLKKPKSINLENKNQNEFMETDQFKEEPVEFYDVSPPASISNVENKDVEFKEKYQDSSPSQSIFNENVNDLDFMTVEEEPKPNVKKIRRLQRSRNTKKNYDNRFVKILQDEFKDSYEPVCESECEAFCKVCKKKLSLKFGRKSLVKHLESILHQENLEPLLKTQKPCGDFVCETCGKSCYTKHKLKLHLAIHSTKRPYDCQFCGKNFRHASALRNHERVHTGEKPFLCSYCGTCFAEMSSRKRHERIHTGAKPYPCAMCGKCFRTADTRNEHTRIHTGERPFRCLTCDVAFNKRNHLASHYKSNTHQIKLSNSSQDNAPNS